MLAVPDAPAAVEWYARDMPSCRVEIFCDDPDALVGRAVECGAVPRPRGVRDHAMPWGTHRQGGFTDPFGHVWFVGDRSPLRPFPAPRGEGK
jgi:hypothetical protein